MVTVDERFEMHLVNPITCEQIALPSVIIIEQVKPIFDKYGAVHKYELSWHTGTTTGYISPLIFALGKLRDEFHYKAFEFPDTSIGSYIVVLIHNPMRQLSFARLGDDKWTWLLPHDLYCDCFYKDGLLYAASRMGELHTFDLSGPMVEMKMTISIPRKYECEYVYIVQAPWGNLLIIWRMFEDLNLEFDPGVSVFWNTTKFRIYEVEAAGSKLKEIKRDHVLFLGHNESLCLSAEEYPSLRKNHAYFTDDNVLWTMD
jgi:hypothetical protein